MLRQKCFAILMKVLLLISPKRCPPDTPRRHGRLGITSLADWALVGVLSFFAVDDSSPLVEHRKSDWNSLLTSRSRFESGGAEMTTTTKGKGARRADPNGRPEGDRVGAVSAGSLCGSRGLEGDDRFGYLVKKLQAADRLGGRVWSSCDYLLHQADTPRLRPEAQGNADAPADTLTREQGKPQKDAEGEIYQAPWAGGVTGSRKILVEDRGAGSWSG